MTSVLVGTSKLAQLDDALGAADVRLSSADIGELDAATPLMPVYPNWCVDQMADQPLTHALEAVTDRHRNNQLCALTGLSWLSSLPSSSRGAVRPHRSFHRRPSRSAPPSRRCRRPDGQYRWARSRKALSLTRRRASWPLGCATPLR
ncbi:MAG: hypothetical protein M3332_02815 [Actinomycetota bacterium]|nr:hypothetical protein [Actinomycetota bacterium]